MAAEKWYGYVRASDFESELMHLNCKEHNAAGLHISTDLPEVMKEAREDVQEQGDVVFVIQVVKVIAKTGVEEKDFNTDIEI